MNRKAFDYWRFKMYQFLIDSPGSAMRYVFLNLVILVSFGLLAGLLDAALGAPEMRWGLTVWFSFVLGFSAVCVFNTVFHLLGLGYEESKSEN